MANHKERSVSLVGVGGAAALVVASLFIVALTLMLLLDAGIRNLSPSAGAVGATEWSGILLAGLLVAALPVEVGADEYIEVDIVYRLLSQRLQAILDFIRWVLLVVFFGALGVASAPWAIDSYQIKERTMGLVTVPVYPVKLLFSAALLLSAALAVGIGVGRLLHPEAPARTRSHLQGE